MLLSSLVSAFALSACFIKGTHQTSHLPSHHRHSRQASAVAASLSNHFDITAGTIERYQPTFKQACQEKKTDVVIQALVHIKDSMSALGSVDVLVEMDVTILTTKVFNLMIKLQVVLKIIEEHQLISSCSGAIVEFKASLQVMISVVASQHTDISAQCKSAGVDLEFYDRVGIKLTLDAKVDVGAGAGGGDGSGSDVGAGVNHDVDASAKVVADFQASVSVTADLQEKVKTACEQKNVDVVVSSLTTIRSSINGLATNVNAFSQVDANVLSTNAISLFVKLQVVLRLISDHGLSSQCQGAIMSLQAPLQTIVGSVGVDASSRIASSVDVNTFTEVGLHVVGTAVGAGHGGIVGTAGGLGGHVDASAKVVTDLHTCISLMQTLELQFKTACDQKNADVLVRGFVSIKTSFEAIGTNNNAFAHIDADILSTNVISLFVRLQVLLRIVSDAKMSTSCQNAMVTLQAPLKSMISVVDSVGINMSARMAAAVDVNLFTQMGLGMGVNAAVGVLGHLGGHLGGTFGANVDAGASAKAFADFKASTGAVVTLAPTFKTACEQKNVAVLNQGLVSIVASMATVGEHVDVLAHVNADDLCNQYFDLLIKVQILLKIIDQHSLTSSCTGSIGSLNVPLKTFLTVLVSMGVDVSAKAKTYTSLDMSFFTKVGVSLDMRGGASFGV